MKSKLLQTLNWANLEYISESLTPTQLKTAGSGSVLCPKCNELNLGQPHLFFLTRPVKIIKH